MAIGIDSASSLFGQNQLNQAHNRLQTSSERLASGKRINKAADDAAGLALAARLANQLLGTNQAQRNTLDGISLAQTAEGALTEVGEITQRMRELAVQSSNGTLSNEDRSSLQAEFSELQAEASRIFSVTEFNGQPLLNQNTSIDIQVGPEAGDLISVSTKDLATQLTTDGFFSADISTAQGAQDALSALNTSLDSVSQNRADFGAISNRFETVIRGLQNNAENVAASQSRIADADYAAETGNRTRDLIQQNASLSMTAQANVTANIAAQLLK
ncbi:MAG: flagellin [Chromatiales bacterium]|jgi:flagellin